MLNLLKKKLTLMNDESGKLVDENLIAHERLKILSKSDDSIQRQACSRELVDCAFDSGFESASRYIIPVWRDLLNDIDAQVRSMTIVGTSDLAGCLIQADYEQGYTLVTNTLIPRILQAIWEDPSPMNRWDASASLVQLSVHLRASDKGDCVLSPLVARISTETNDENRSIITNSFGCLSSSLGPVLTAKFIVAQLCALSEDPSPKVRRCTVQAIREVVRTNNGPEPRLVLVFQRLCVDASAAVRNTCIDAFPDILSCTPQSDIDINQLLCLYTSLATEDTSLAVKRTAIARVGRIIACPSVSVSDPLFTLYVTEYSDRGTLESQAEKFGEVTSKLGCDYWDRGLQKLFARLATAEEERPRICIAQSVASIGRALGPEILNMDDVIDLILALLADPVYAVSRSVVCAIPDLYLKLSCENRAKFLSTILAECQRYWRYRKSTSEMLLNLLQMILNYSTSTTTSISPIAVVSDEYHTDQLIELWRILVSDGAASVREHAIRSSSYLMLCVCEEWTNPSYECIELMSTIVSLFSRSSRCYERQVYIQIATECMASRAIPMEVTETILLKPLMHLAHDLAATVRTTWAREVAPLLRFPGGRWAHHTDLVILAHQLLLDMDKEVVRNITRVSFSPLDELHGATPPPPISPGDTELVMKIKKLLHDFERRNSVGKDNLISVTVEDIALVAGS